jgi:hypothetical protein
MKRTKRYYPKLFLLLGAFFGLSVSVIANEDSASLIIFSISRNGKIIGQLNAQSNNCTQGQKYTLNSQLKGKLIFEINVVQHSESITSGGFLLSSVINQKINGSTSIYHGLLFKNGAYHSTGEGKVEGPLPEKIAFSTNIMYFKEPVGCRQVYSEVHKKMIPLSCIGRGIYRINISEGKYTEFQYKLGMLVKVVSKSIFGEVIFQRG